MAGQESRERDSFTVSVDRFGKLCNNQERG